MVWAVRIVAAVLALTAAVLAAGCGGSGGDEGLTGPKIAPARTFKLAAFQPAGTVRPRVPTTLRFFIEQPDGRPLTRFKTGPGPHTGVHLIVVRKDLSTIVHRHPPIAPDGTITQRIVFPKPGPYRILVDVYPRLGPSFQQNFQLFGNVDVSGRYRPVALPRFEPNLEVGGAYFDMKRPRGLRSLRPAFLHVRVTNAAGRPAKLSPWYGALAHAIFFKQGSLDYFHTHVCGAGASGCVSALGGSRVTGHATGDGKIAVGVLLPVSGTWRLFLQARIGGRVVTAPFTLNVSR
jgi:hypothetical protein